MTENNKFWYTESQGTRDFEILRRYRSMIDYFEENPDRITEKNMKMLSPLYDHDMVLRRDMKSRKRLLDILDLGRYNTSEEIVDKINRNLREDFDKKLSILLSGGNM